MKKMRLAFFLGVAVAFSSCSSSQRGLSIQGSEGPDEFGIVPKKPLQMPPKDFALPKPTPGGSNLTDPTPGADAIAALGGNINETAPIDPSLTAYTDRFGTNNDIRQILSAEDLAWRKRHRGRPLERLFNVNVYYRSYLPQSLNPYTELAAWRARGVRVPQAPPLKNDPDDKAP